MEDMEQQSEKLVGVISDTHGLVRPEALGLLRGCELIIHAGDIGKAHVIKAFRDLAPVAAVRGNVDRGEWAFEFPEALELEIEALRILVIHDLKSSPLDPVSAGFHAVIFGHSHKPHMEWREGVLFLNPGSAGPRRFKLPVSLALLHIRGGSMDAEFKELKVEGKPS